MFWVGATSFFALLCLASIIFALRGENERVSSWFVAVVAALLCGMMFGNFVQNGRLTAHIDLLTRETERLQEENVALNEQLSRVSASERLPVVQSASSTPVLSSSRPPDDTAAPVSTVDTSGADEATNPTGGTPAQQEASTAEDSSPPAPTGGADGTETEIEAEANPETPTALSADNADTPAPETSTRPPTSEGEATATPPSPTAPNETTTAPGGTTEAPGETAPPALSGVWEVRTTIEETSYPAFLGTQLTFRVDLTREGSSLQAAGEKLSEQSAEGAVRDYAPGSRTPITMAGSFLGERLVQLAFEEQGTSRSSGGNMLLTVVSPERLEGSFSSNAAGSAGRVVFERVAGE